MQSPVVLVPEPTAAPGLRLRPSAAGRCRRRVHLDHDPDADRRRLLPIDDGTRHRLDDISAHTALLGQRLAALHPGAPTGAAAQTALTASGGSARPPVLLDVSLVTTGRVGRVDLLVWDGTGYLPVLVRSHRTTDAGAGAVIADPAAPLATVVSPERKVRGQAADLLALCHVYRQLAELGVASVHPRGAVIGRGRIEEPVDGAPAPDDGDHLLWHELSEVLPDYDARFADRLAVATAAALRAPALAAATRIGECRRCPWWPVCESELAARHDISLVTAGSDTDVMQSAGISTLDELVALPAAQVAHLPLTGIEPTSARVRALAWLAGAPLVRRSGRITVPRADLELDVDMESYLEDGAYLWGTMLTGPGVTRLGLTPGYRPFVTWRPLPDADEGRAFADFWAYLSTLRSLAARHGLTFAAYCYSRWAEERWLRSTPIRYPHVPGMPTTQQIESFCSSPQWVDMFQQIRDQFVVPGSMKLKALAPIAGFHWRDRDPGGENSMAWYRAAVGMDGPPQRSQAERVLAYNEDDVRATLALREWMTHRSGTVPTAAELGG